MTIRAPPSAPSGTNGIIAHRPLVRDGGRAPPALPCRCHCSASARTRAALSLPLPHIRPSTDSRDHLAGKLSLSRTSKCRSVRNLARTEQCDSLTCGLRVMTHASSHRPLQLRCAVHAARFSMVELIVVVLVTSIFAAAAMPTFHRFAVVPSRRIRRPPREGRSRSGAANRPAYQRAQTITFSRSHLHSQRRDCKIWIGPAEIYSVDLSEPPYELTSVAANFGSNHALPSTAMASPPAAAPSSSKPMTTSAP